LFQSLFNFIDIVQNILKFSTHLMKHGPFLGVIDPTKVQAAIGAVQASTAMVHHSRPDHLKEFRQANHFLAEVIVINNAQQAANTTKAATAVNN
jgi:hypothetical protein